MFSDFSRSSLLIGDEALERLAASHVVVFGLGGVGSYAVEALARSAVGSFTLVDGDSVEPSNINRQLFALESTMGKPKVNIAKQRILDINPSAKVEAVNLFYLPENAERISFDCDYIIDAVDTVTAKLEIIRRAKALGVPVISAMGAGNKLVPHFEVADIFDTSVCPLCKVMRRELREMGIDTLKVVYSKEAPKRIGKTIGSVSFVPPVCGLVIAGEVIRELAGFANSADIK